METETDQIIYFNVYGLWTIRRYKTPVHEFKFWIFRENYIQFLIRTFKKQSLKWKQIEPTYENLHDLFKTQNMG